MSVSVTNGLKKDDNIIFDKIINLKLKRNYSRYVNKYMYYNAEHGEYVPDASALSKAGQRLILSGKPVISEFVSGPKLQQDIIIRSDYELVDKGEHFSVEKCKYKPDIQVSYTTYAGGTAVQAKIKIANFHIYSSEGDSLASFSNSDSPITSIEVHMGYLNQFPELSNQLAYPVETYEQQYKLLNTFFYFEDELNVAKITFNVLAAYKEDSTVDGYTVFECSIGKVVNPEPTSVSVSSSNFSLREFLYESITKKFSRFVYAQDKFKQDDTNKGPTAKDIELYGQFCYVSELAEKIFKIPKLVDAENGKEVDFEAELPVGNYAISFLERVIEILFPTLRYTLDLSGNFLIYSAFEEFIAIEGWKAYTENESGVGSLKALELNPEERALPALYNISMNAQPVINCPFYPGYKPLQKIAVISRYNAGNLVSYYYKADASFEGMIVSTSVEFATVKDTNNMQMTFVLSKEIKRRRVL